MREEELIGQVNKLKDSLLDIEKRLPEGTIPMTVLRDFKTAVDHTRLTVWALLSSEKSDPGEVARLLVRFRLLRAAEICKQISQDISSGEIVVSNPELPFFQTTLRETLARIERLYQSR